MTASLATRVRDAATLPPELDRVVTLIQAGDYQAAALLMRDLADAPGAGPLEWYWMAVLLQGMRDNRGAAAMFSAVLDLEPDCTPARYNRGVTFECQGLTEAAIADYRRMLEDRPADVMSLVNLGGCLYRIGKPREGYAMHERALGVSIPHEDAESLAVRSAVRLLRGDYVRGFQEYEARRRMGQFKASNWAPAWGKPWDGRKTNSSVLLYHEQGVGDTIQMLRYVDAAAEMSGRPVTLCVQPALAGLVERGLYAKGYVRRVVTRESEWLSRPHWHAPLMSMPYLAETTLESIPDEPYLYAPLGPDERAIVVGVCWAGNRDHNNDHDRSAPRGETLRPLFDVPGVTWQSLQYGAPRVAGLRPLEARDFADTAAVVASCDLVISVDTSVAHLAGALGVPVWLCAPTSPEWRWLLDREDSPWYPTMRIFRRASTTAWAPMVEAMAAELRRLV